MLDDLDARLLAGVIKREVEPMLRAVVREEIGRTARLDPDKLLPVREAAALLHLTPNALYKAVEVGSIKAIRVGGRRLRFRTGDLLGGKK